MNYLLGSEQFQRANSFVEQNFYFSLNEPSFEEAIFLILSLSIFWLACCYLELNYKLCTKLFNGNTGLAHDSFSFTCIYYGGIRNRLVVSSITNNIKINYGSDSVTTILEIVGLGIILFSYLLILSSFYRLGIRNMFYGDFFGFFMKEKIESFPYNFIGHPQYVAASFLYIGYALFYHSPSGIIMAFFTFLSYFLFYLYERTLIDVFYPSDKSLKDKAN